MSYAAALGVPLCRLGCLVFQHPRWARPLDEAVISIVDDDESSRLGIMKLVRSLGFAGHDFSSASAFLSSSELARTSCVISDIQMPEMSGIQLLDALRARGHTMPVV